MNRRCFQGSNYSEGLRMESKWNEEENRDSRERARGEEVE